MMPAVPVWTKVSSLVEHMPSWVVHSARSRVVAKSSEVASLWALKFVEADAIAKRLIMDKLRALMMY